MYLYITHESGLLLGISIDTYIYSALCISCWIQPVVSTIIISGFISLDVISDNDRWKSPFGEQHTHPDPKSNMAEYSPCSSLILVANESCVFVFQNIWRQ